MLENCCRKNTPPTIGKMTVISRWIVRLKTPENILALAECYAVGRLNVRDTFSRWESLYVRRNSGFAQMAFWEKDWQRNQGDWNNREEGGNNGVCSDEQPLSCRGIAQLTNWDWVANFLSKKLQKRKNEKWAVLVIKEAKMLTRKGNPENLVRFENSGGVGVCETSWFGWLNVLIVPISCLKPKFRHVSGCGDKVNYGICLIEPFFCERAGGLVGGLLIIKWWYEMTLCPCVWDGEMTPRFLLSPWGENTRGGCSSLWYYVQPTKS